MHSGSHIQSDDRLERAALEPIVRTGAGFYALAGVLSCIVALGVYAWCRQLVYGMEVTGLNYPVFWGIYITNFVFFIGISHAGTLISAILRVTGAEWRRPITRLAEAITVFALMVGPINVLFDLGRPDRALNIFKHGSFHSPLLWDVTCIGTYLIASITYLYLPLLPDIALLRDRGTRHRFLYRFLAMGWSGTEKQKRALEVAIGIMAVVIIPIAVSVHTVVSWVFAMTIQPMWHSTIFGPYFVVGAIFSGIATLIIAMAIVRKAFHLEEYMQPLHFNFLGLLLLTMSLLWFYFTLAEYLTTFYGQEPSHIKVLQSKLTGPFAPCFWLMALCCFGIPFPILAIRKTRTVSGTVLASVLVNIGMWLERYTIVVPTLSHPRLPWTGAIYHPTWIEWSLTAGCFAGFTLLFVLFGKFFPMLPVWEIKEAEAAETARKAQALPAAQPM